MIRDALDKHPDTRLIVLDTLGRIMPLPLQGETTYQRDYRVAVALKRIADEQPGLTIIVIHHTRKAFSDDFIDSISGTHGLAGAADTIITLARGRGKGEGVLRVTGRDVIEADYAVTFRGGVWSARRGHLDEARANVRRRAEAGALGDRSAEIIEFIRERPAGATAQQIGDKFGDDGTRTSSASRSRAGSPGPSAASMWCQNRPKCPKRRSAARKSDTDHVPLSEVSETPEAPAESTEGETTP